jgi:type II secretory pathway component GspD/PulD (secretin)
MRNNETDLRYPEEHNIVIMIRLLFATLRSIKKIGVLLLLIVLLQAAGASRYACAQDYSQDLHITYQNNQLDISARDVDIKTILLKLAEITHTHVRFPDSIKKEITLKRSGISLKKALQRLLEGFNHAIVYTRVSETRTKVAEVYVFSEAKMNRRTSSAERRADNRIRLYERQIESIKKRLATMDASSSRARSYSRRIEILEQKIENLRR